MDKQLLRQEILRQRDALSSQDVHERSASIMRRFLKMPFYRDAQTILFYYPKGKEMNTEPIIRYASRLGKSIALPVANPVTKTLQLYTVPDLDADLAISTYGIKEPRRERGKEVTLRDIDLIVVPALGVDVRGNRLGYGLGYYDRLLASYSGPTVALVYDFQVLLHVPAESHDIPIWHVITESKHIDCRKLNK